MVVQVVLDTSPLYLPLLLLHDFKSPHCHFFFKNIPVSCLCQLSYQVVIRIRFCFSTWTDSSGIRFELVCFLRVGEGWLGAGCVKGRNLTFLPSLLSAHPVCSLFLMGMFRKQVLPRAAGPAECPSPTLTQHDVGRDRFVCGAALFSLCWSVELELITMAGDISTTVHQHWSSHVHSFICSVVCDGVLWRDRDTDVSGSFWQDAKDHVYVWLS